MKTLIRSAFGALLIVALLGLVTQASAEEPVEDQLLSVFGELSTGLKAAEGDCPKVAEAMNAWTDKHAKNLTVLSAAMDERMKELNEEEAKAFEKKFTPVIETLMGSAMACAENKEVQAAFENLDKVMTASAEGESKDSTAPQKSK